MCIEILMRLKRGSSLFFGINLILSIIAFSFTIGVASTQIVSALDPTVIQSLEGMTQDQLAKYAADKTVPKEVSDYAAQLLKERGGGLGTPSTNPVAPAGASTAVTEVAKAAATTPVKFPFSVADINKGLTIEDMKGLSVEQMGAANSEQVAALAKNPALFKDIPVESWSGMNSQYASLVPKEAWANVPYGYIEKEMPVEFLKASLDAGTVPAETLAKLTPEATSALSSRLGVYQGYIPKSLGWQSGSLGSGLMTAALWAAVAYGLGQLIGRMMGLQIGETSSLSAAMAAGAFVGGVLYSTSPGAVGLSGSWVASSGGFAGAGASFGIGFVVFAIVLAATYRHKEYVDVNYICKPWQAAMGTNECETCNTNIEIPCTEYKCKSLGATCYMINVNTKDEKCVKNTTTDIKPPILTPDTSLLSDGFKYTDVRNMPPGPGFRIVTKDGKCIPAFTPLQFGISTNKPSRCKIDSNQTSKFESMQFWLGGTNLFLYNHTEKFSLPGPANLGNSNMTVENGGEWTFYVRCQDVNSNVNEAEYAVRFCVDPSPDTTPPSIAFGSIENGGCVAKNSDKSNVEFYVNEPAQCRWSFDDQDYESMPNEMNCDKNMYEMNVLLTYTCRANLTSISRDGTKFYIRCKDQPEAVNESNKNTNKQSYVYELHTSSDLKITKVGPTATVFGSTDPAPFYLESETMNGCQNGNSTCFYAKTGDKNFVQFFDTNSNVHKQRLDLSAGSHSYDIKCIDGGGNTDLKTVQFKVEITKEAPIITRAYDDNGMLKITTARPSECSYNLDPKIKCDFSINEGTKMPTDKTTAHVTDWKKENTYYIKCRDEFKNEENDCSMVIKPSDLFYSGK